MWLRAVYAKEHRVLRRQASQETEVSAAHSSVHQFETAMLFVHDVCAVRCRATAKQLRTENAVPGSNKEERR